MSDIEERRKSERTFSESGDRLYIEIIKGSQTMLLPSSNVSIGGVALYVPQDVNYSYDKIQSAIEKGVVLDLWVKLPKSHKRDISCLGSFKHIYERFIGLEFQDMAVEDRKCLQQYINYLCKKSSLNNFKYRILLVEDNVSNLKLLQKILLKLGYLNTLTATHVRDAVEILKKEKSKVDLIITDINMPDINGLNFISMLRKQKIFEETPILVCSSNQSKAVVTCLKNKNLSGYLLKPYNINLIKECIERVFYPEDDRQFDISADLDFEPT